VTREDFRRELGDAFDGISGSPNPALSDRVRSALAQAPERRGPVWIAALAAAVIAVILVGVLLIANPLNRRPLVPGGTGQSTPTASPAPSPSINPSPTASTDATPFICAASSKFTGHQPPPSAFVDAVRTGTHTGYDRLTIEFKNGQPGSIELRPQAGTSFKRAPSDQSVKLAGKAGLLVIIHTADAHAAYSGSTDFKTPQYPGLLEARELEDFEGYVQWGLGLAKPACYRAVILTNPTRLVIDIRTS
jgi:hypothetical protein